MFRKTMTQTVVALLGALCLLTTGPTMAGEVPTLDPTTIPQYVTPLVIPPVMANDGAANSYDIAVRQFKQQILPGGIWATLPGCAGKDCTFPPTTVWSYGPAADPLPKGGVAPAANSQFNYPAYTVETTANTAVVATRQMVVIAIKVVAVLNGRILGMVFSAWGRWWLSHHKHVALASVPGTPKSSGYLHSG